MDLMQFRKAMDEETENRKFLFIRGFLMTDRTDLDMDGFPFYGSWKVCRREGMTFCTHPLTGFHLADIPGGGVLFLFGHAYDPFTMEHEEGAILERLAAQYGQEDFLERVSDLTGVFVLGRVTDGAAEFLVDPSGMQSACCGRVEEHFYLTSHPQLVGDVCGLTMDPFVERLVAYKWYPRVMGAYLPANLTPFRELKRVVPNIFYTYEGAAVSHRRFYPIRDLPQCKDEEEYQAVIKAAADILRNNMTLIARKWERPWISLTGGIDSNTTFAAANGKYEKFETFSYLSAEKESIDCEAAEKIAARFSVPWTQYRIPETEESLKNYELKVEIIRHNNGYIAREKSNELRKRVFLEERLPADVEVKSWVSETIRGYWYKHYGRKKMPPLSAKLYRNLYKIFLFDRKLAREVDRLFEVYLNEFEYYAIPSQYPSADMHYNEVTWGSWGGLNISEMKFYTDITFAYNNRRFLDLLFRVPLEQRISDRHHLDMKKYLNPELYDMNIRVVNMHETRFRAFCLNVIFTINSILPF